MIKVTPYKISYYNNTNSMASNAKPSTKSTQSTYNNSMSYSYYLSPEKTILNKATNKLNEIEFDQKDMDYLQSIGVVLPFKSGKEALNFIKTNNVGIEFAPLPKHVHAQYHFDTNSIQINNLYKNAQSPALILAISESILHEAGHAKDQDSDSSIQEEIDCLGMNVLAHRAISKQNPNIFEGDNSLIVKDGVCIYTDLFFNQSADKTKLIERLNKKYGNLQAGDTKHSPGELALKVKGLNSSKNKNLQKFTFDLTET